MHKQKNTEQEVIKKRKSCENANWIEEPTYAALVDLVRQIAVV